MNEKTGKTRFPEPRELTQAEKELLREWMEAGNDLADAAGQRKLAAAFSLYLHAELALAPPAVLTEAPEPATKLASLQEVAERVAQLRREETNPDRARVITKN